MKKPELFKLFLKMVFRYKNKNLSNALTKAYPFLKADLKVDEKKFNQITSSLEISDLKVYLVESKDFVSIFEKLF